MTRVPLKHQIAEVERELALRTNVYPGLISKRKMRRAEADEHVRRMQAALTTLRFLDGHGLAPA